MKLTTKGRYAVMAMADLASYSNNSPVSLSEICQTKYFISLSRTAFHSFERKTVKSVRGVKGGYANVPVSEIKLSNIFFAVNEEIKL